MNTVKNSSILREIMLNIGRHVKEERLKRGWEVLDLVAKSDVSMGTIYKLEAKIADNISIKSIISLATALEMDVKDLMI